MTKLETLRERLDRELDATRSRMQRRTGDPVTPLQDYLIAYHDGLLRAINVLNQALSQEGAD